ncbi:MAG: hypothetical protein PWP07_1406 [Epulopiscium sp.]|jgi:hypothetical protein|nr:hypothetical protein [Defluviitaleaceae bacterium]MDK2788181.1 hypothetical protein [Candidatus Epulonipiscium sp.]
MGGEDLTNCREYGSLPFHAIVVHGGPGARGYPIFLPQSIPSMSVN